MPESAPHSPRLDRVTDLNAIDQRVFPPTARRGRQCGRLKLADIAATDLVQEFGSPLYVVDEQAARNQAALTRESLQREFSRVGTEATVYYASKAFLCVEVAKWMSEEGLNLDVSTGGEFAVALAAGVHPSRIGFHGNNKSDAEIERAVNAGVGSLVIDSEQEVDRVAAAAKLAGVRQRVRLRINSGVHAGAHDYLSTAHEDQKFGLPMSKAIEVSQRIAAHESLEFIGLHCHIGSQIFAADAFRESARRLLSVYATLGEELGFPVPELNLGGGFGIAYTPEQAGEAPDIAELAGQLADIVASSCEEAGIAIPKVAFEPGRSLIGQSGVTLYTVGTTKPVQLAGSDAADNVEPGESKFAGFSERLYVSVDGGMSDNARPALYGADYHAVLANRASDADAQLVRVVGKHCESGDIVVQQELLPSDVVPGDLLAVAATGAYCWSLSSNYNYVPRPPVVAVRGGEARLIVRGQTEEELVAQSVV